MKRVVTGHDADGKSIVVAAGAPPHTVDVTALSWRELWATFAEDTLPRTDSGEPTSDSRWSSVYPSPGGSAFRLLEFRPAEYDANSAAALWTEEELTLIQKRLPGTLEHLEADTPGMHTTDTVDYGIVLQGRIRLELDQEAIDLEAGDVVIQNGTRHAWRPLERTLMAFVLVGVERSKIPSHT